MRELEVREVRVDTAGGSPVVVLREVGGDRLVPVWMSATGAAAIATATETADELRPCVHDLLAGLIATSGSQLDEVRLTEYVDGQFFAELVFGQQTVPARPSDAIALALRLACPIRCADEVLKDAGVSPDGQDEVERFREFLDNVSPDDFQPPGAQ